MDIKLVQVDWPEATAFDYMIIAAFALVILIAFIVLRGYYSRKLDKERTWLKILNYARDRDIGDAQISILRSFFFSLPRKEGARFAEDKSPFYDRLFGFLEKRGDVSEEKKVQLLDLFFAPDIKACMDGIASLKDLREGEACALDFVDDRYLGTIIKVKSPVVLIHVPDMQGEDEERWSDPVKLYIYRHDAGGFLLSGFSLSTGEQFLYFWHDGTVTPMSESHLLAEAALQFELLPWPQKERAEAISGITDKITDRAFSFYFACPADAETYEDNREEIWELTLPLSEDYSFVCRGRILRSKEDLPDLYYFKYIDVSEDDRYLLFNFLKSAGGRREILYVGGAR